MATLASVLGLTVQQIVLGAPITSPKVIRYMRSYLRPAAPPHCAAVLLSARPQSHCLRSDGNVPRRS